MYFAAPLFLLNHFASICTATYHSQVRDLAERANQSIVSRRLLRPRQKVLVAVSGGLDSMALLHILYELAPHNGWQLTVAHLNHQLRGRASEADERLVIRTARKLGLPVLSERADIKSEARARKLSIEMAARTIRHEFLALAAARLRIHTIALAHHADDQLELFFLRLLRGSGNEGLAGMKWKSPSPGNPKIELIRPLLDQPKAALGEYVATRKIPFREDSSNASIDFQRNRIRHELLPLLRRNYQPAVARTISRVMEIAGTEAEFVGQIAADWLNGSNRRLFQKLPVAVQRRCIQLQLLSREVPVDYDLVEHLRTKPGHSIKVSPQLTVISGVGGRLDFRESPVATGSGLSRCEVDLRGRAGELVFGKVKIHWRLVSAKPRGLPGRRAGREAFDADKVGSPIVLRHWRAGDRLQPIGMPSRIKLQDLFTNNRIGREERHRLVIATTRDGELFWVENLRISERFKLSSHTIRRLQWRWKRL